MIIAGDPNEKRPRNINITRANWAKVKSYAELEDLRLEEAVERLLAMGLAFYSWKKERHEALVP